MLTHDAPPCAFVHVQEAPVEKSSYVYILASEAYGTLYVGVTSDLVRRVFEHREALVAGFSKEYGAKRLVWYEVHQDIMAAITREKQIKKWNRDWKINLIQKSNPDWRDLFDEVAGWGANLDSRLRGNDVGLVADSLDCALFWDDAGLNRLDNKTGHRLRQCPASMMRSCPLTRA